jgi:hypothetical protein
MWTKEAVHILKQYMHIPKMIDENHGNVGAPEPKKEMKNSLERQL